MHSVTMLRQGGSRLCLVLVAFTSCTFGKLPPGAPWTNYVGKSPVYSRSLGPPPMAGVGTISVPYIPKPSFFPKFVDPKVMISKKTDLLNTLFGGIGPVKYGPYSVPSGPYGFGGETNSLDQAKAEASLKNSLKATLGGASDYKRGLFGSMGPKYPGAFGPEPQQGFSEQSTSSRRRRSIDDSPNSSASVGDMSKGTSFLDDLLKNSNLASGGSNAENTAPPPPYPGLGPIPEETESTDETRSLGITPDSAASASETAPREYMPGMFGPYGPLVMDPSMYMAKKSAFLDTLFKTLATTTPPPSPPSTPPTTDVPVPKSTIVPPGFWFPTSIIPSPTEYDNKVTEFLDKLFDTLKLNKTTSKDGTPTTSGASSNIKSEFSRSLETDSSEVKVARSLDDLAEIIAAKDSIVDSILTELSDLKGDMVTTLDDLIAYQKTTVPPFPPFGTKPFKSFPPGLLMRPTVDSALPFKQRMIGLSQVFDMLTELERNITTAVQEAIKAKAISTTTTSTTQAPVNDEYLSDINLTLLDAIKKKLVSMESTSLPGGPSEGGLSPKTSRTLSKAPTSVWVAYPQSTSSIAKRQVESVPEQLAQLYNEDQYKDQYSRGVEMKMHQGYQSLPPGAVESVQAGGGSVPGHQGGGIKLLGADKGGTEWKDWGEFLGKSFQRHRHHHDHR